MLDKAFGTFCSPEIQEDHANFSPGKLGDICQDPGVQMFLEVPGLWEFFAIILDFQGTLLCLYNNIPRFPKWFESKYHGNYL